MRILRTICSVAALFGFAALPASAQHDPFAEVTTLCSQDHKNFEQAVNAFIAEGWTQRTDVSANESVQDLMYLTLFFGSDPEVELAPDALADEFAARQQQARGLLGFEMNKKVLLFPKDRTDISPLILAFEVRGSGNKNMRQLLCTLAGSQRAEVAWLDALAEAGKLSEPFVEFNPSTHNFAFAAPADEGAFGTRVVYSSLSKLSRDRIEPALPRPMPYDLFYSVLSAHFDER